MEQVAGRVAKPRNITPQESLADTAAAVISDFVKDFSKDYATAKAEFDREARAVYGAADGIEFNAYMKMAEDAFGEQWDLAQDGAT
jgi:hypothetical protein